MKRLTSTLLSLFDGAKRRTLRIVRQIRDCGALPTLAPRGILRVFLLPRSIRWIVSRRAQGSWLWTLPVLCVALVIAFSRFQTQGLTSLCWIFTPTVLIAVAWLSAASHLISSALRVAGTFEAHAHAFFGSRVPSRHRWNKLQNRVLAPRRYLAASACYLIPVSTVLVILTLSNDDKTYILHALVLLPSFYYGGYGIWGAVVSSNAVSDLCRMSRKRLNVFHQDRLGGLGFARQYANATSLHLSTGVLLVPIGVEMIMDAWDIASDGHSGALAASLLCGVALLSWVFFTALAGLRGRLAISSALQELRDRTLTGIARDRESLRALRVPAHSLAKRRREEEEAALQLQAGIILGSGAWRELRTVLVALATAVLTGLVNAW